MLNDLILSLIDGEKNGVGYLNGRPTFAKWHKLLGSPEASEVGPSGRIGHESPFIDARLLTTLEKKSTT